MEIETELRGVIQSPPFNPAAHGGDQIDPARFKISARSSNRRASFKSKTLTVDPAHEFPHSRIHLLSNFRVKMLTGLEFEDRDEVCCVNQPSIFRAFAVAPGAFVCPFGERVDPFLHRRLNLELDHATRGLRIEAPA